MQIVWTKTNCPHSLISPGRRQTFAPRYMNVCFGWKSPVSFWWKKSGNCYSESKHFAYYCSLFLSLLCQKNPTHLTVAYYLLSYESILRGGSVTSYVCSNIPSIYNDLINGGFRFPKDRYASEPNDGISNGTSKQRPTVQGYFVH